MNTNVGMLDRLIRIALGAILLLSPLLNMPAVWSSEPLAYTAMAIGLVLFATGLTGYCLIYRALGISTNTP